MVGWHKVGLGDGTIIPKVHPMKRASALEQCERSVRVILRSRRHCPTNPSAPIEQRAAMVDRNEGVELSQLIHRAFETHRLIFAAPKAADLGQRLLAALDSVPV